jgi:hypothetical protein
MGTEPRRKRSHQAGIPPGRHIAVKVAPQGKAKVTRGRGYFPVRLILSGYEWEMPVAGMPET